MKLTFMQHIVVQFMLYRKCIEYYNNDNGNNNSGRYKLGNNNRDEESIYDTCYYIVPLYMSTSWYLCETLI